MSEIATAVTSEVEVSEADSSEQREQPNVPVVVKRLGIVAGSRVCQLDGDKCSPNEQCFRVKYHLPNPCE